jgi:hypothetical protein
MKSIGLMFCLVCAAIPVAVAAGCGNDTAGPTSPTANHGSPPELSAAGTNKGLSICSWGLGDNATGDSYLDSGMNQDGTYQISQYVNFPGLGEPQFYIDSKPTAGLTTVYKDTLVVVKGNLPASSYSSWPWGTPPPADTTAITLALDLRLVVTPHRGTGLLPSGGYTRLMLLSGTINGVEISSGSGISDISGVGRFGHVGAHGATPFQWSGGNGGVTFCTH